MNLIEVKVRYVKETEDGGKKKVTETYLVDAMTFTEAEERIIEEFKAFQYDEFTVEAVRKNSYADQYITNEGKYYKVKVRFTVVDEASGKTKNKNVCYLVEAKDFRSAVEHTSIMLKDTVMDAEIVAVSETNIVDIIMEGQL